MILNLPLGDIRAEQIDGVLVLSGIPEEWTVELTDMFSGQFTREGDQLRCTGMCAVEFWGKEYGYSHVLWGDAGLWGPSPSGMEMLMLRE